jgi:hypothetical protein
MHFTLRLVIAFVALAPSAASASQRFCSPQGTFEINPTSFAYKPAESSVPNDRVVKAAKRRLAVGFDELQITRTDGATVKFVPDDKAIYAPSTAGFAKKWPGWRSCQ